MISAGQTRRPSKVSVELEESSTMGWSFHADRKYSRVLIARTLNMEGQGMENDDSDGSWTTWTSKTIFPPSRRGHSNTRFISLSITLFEESAIFSPGSLSDDVLSSNEETILRLDRPFQGAILFFYFPTSLAHGFHLSHPFHWYRSSLIGVSP